MHREARSYPRSGENCEADGTRALFRIQHATQAEHPPRTFGSIIETLRSLTEAGPP